MKVKVTIRYQVPPEVNDVQLEAMGTAVRRELTERDLTPDVGYPLALGCIEVTATVEQRPGTGGVYDAIRTVAVVVNSAAQKVTGSWPALGSDMIIAVSAGRADLPPAGEPATA